MSEATDAGGLDWYTQLVVLWIAQGEEDPKSVESDLLLAALEKCEREQRRKVNQEFSLDAWEYLNNACRRLANRLFGIRDIVTSASASIPVPHPFNDDRVQVFVELDCGTCRPFLVKASAGATAIEIPSAQGNPMLVSLFPHNTPQLRRLSLSRKMNEVVDDAVNAAERKARKIENATVRDYHHLLESRDRVHDEVQAKMLFERLVQEAGPRNFIDYFADAPDYLRDYPQLFPAALLDNRLKEFGSMNPTALRAAKSRGKKAILKAAERMGWDGPSGNVVSISK